MILFALVSFILHPIQFGLDRVMEDIRPARQPTRRRIVMAEYIKVPEGTCHRCRGMGADPTGSDVPCWDCDGTGKRRVPTPQPEGGYYFDKDLGVVIGPDPKGTASTPEQALREAGM